MALNSISRLRILKMALDMLRAKKQTTLDEKVVLVRQAALAADIQPQVDTLFANLLTEMDAAIVRVQNAIAAVTVSAADRTSYAQAAETEAKS